jgi:hypothetical protein
MNPTLEQLIELLAALAMSLNQSQSGCGTMTTTTMKSSARKIDSRKWGKTGTAGRSEDDDLTCYNSGHVGDISQNCQHGKLMKQHLEKSLVGKDAPTAKSGCSHTDMQRGQALTGRNDT